MPAERYFNPHSLFPNEQLILEDQEFHHLINVMRTRLGESVEVVNGLGQLATAELTALEKKRAVLTIQDVKSIQPPTQHIILAQAIPRPNRLDTILEKGTELGMTEIWLFPTVHSERKAFSDNQQERLNTITVAAMKQCGRLFLPKIVFKPFLKEWQSLPYPALFGDTDSTAPKLASCLPMPNVIFFIGPESGFNEDEENCLKKLGAKGVSLHNNILRTDTAAITALSIVTHLNN